MVAVAVDAFHDQVIRAGDGFCVAQERRGRVAEVASADEDTAILEREMEHGSTENVPGIKQGQGKTGEFRLDMVIKRLPIYKRIMHVVQIVERLLAMVAPRFAGEDAGAVLQYEFGELAGRSGRIYLSSEAFLDQFRYAADVVEMRMGDEQIFYLFRIIAKGIPIELLGGSFALNQSAVDEDLAATRNVDEKIRSRDRTDSAIRNENRVVHEILGSLGLLFSKVSFIMMSAAMDPQTPFAMSFAVSTQ